MKTDLGLWTVDERRNRQDLVEFQYFMGLSRVRIDELFMLDENTKGTHCLKLRKTRCTRHFFRIAWSVDGTCWISRQSMYLA